MNMDAFQKVDDGHYLCFCVRNARWCRRAQRYVENKTILFDNKADALKCFAAIESYEKKNIDVMQYNTFIKDVFVYDGDTFHLMSGLKIKHTDYAHFKEATQAIENKHPANSWEYLDAYAILFNNKPRMPRSCLGSIFCCMCCLCTCCMDDVGICTYSVAD